MSALAGWRGAQRQEGLVAVPSHHPQATAPDFGVLVAQGGDGLLRFGDGLVAHHLQHVAGLQSRPPGPGCPASRRRPPRPSGSAAGSSPGARRRSVGARSEAELRTLFGRGLLHRGVRVPCWEATATASGSLSWPSRRTVICWSEPDGRAATICASARGSFTACEPMLVITSPGWKPAAAAGLSFCTSATSAPVAPGSCSAVRHGG